MKVFTVGLDQKPPIKDASDPPAEKTAGGSPPPGYATATKVAHVPLPMGPEIPQPLQPIVVRKSRGYKGILMVMLAVFLMALFALTLSEIAYNRQRDENFFRLRWAELKHRLGYGDNAFDYYHHRANGALNNDRFFSLSKNKELSEALLQQAEPTSSSTTTSPSSSTSEPVVAIDSFPPKPSSFEQQPMDGPNSMIRDARLQFLKTILQKIKQHAEDMGFDGTMQVSVIEVEPQIDEPFSPFGSQHQPPHSMGKSQSQLHPFLPHFFPHFPIDEQQPPKSDSFLDGFGEYHQPSFMQNNQVVEQNRARANSGPFGGWPHDDDNSQQQQPHGEFGDVAGAHWPRPNSSPFRPEGFFHPPNNWPVPQQQSFPHPPHILPRPPSFDRWSGGQMGNNGIVDGGDDNSQQQQPSQQLHNGQHQPPMIQIFPQQQQQAPMPMLPPMLGPNAQQQQPNEQPSNEGDSSSQMNGSPSQEVVGEIYGRKFGRMLQDIIGKSARFQQDIIANRLQGFQNMQQMNFIPPEDRIQVEPPQAFPVPNNNQPPMGEGPHPPPPPQSQPPRSTGSDEPQQVKTLIDNNMPPANGPRGWTHQFPKGSQQQQSDSNSDEQGPSGQMTGNRNASPEEMPSFGNTRLVDGATSGSAKSNEQPSIVDNENNNNNNEDDVWLTGPPNRTPTPRRLPASFSAETPSNSDSASPVDFPAVKFPTNTNNKDLGSIPNNDDKPVKSGSASLDSPQNDHQPAQPLLSNPVFFQVDDPSSLEQPQGPRTVVA